MVLSKNKHKATLNLDIVMGGHRLELCETYEYLGVKLDYRLNLDRMVGKTISSASNRLYMFSKLRNKMSNHVANRVYKQTILPVLEYCGFLYNGFIFL